FREDSLDGPFEPMINQDEITLRGSFISKGGVWPALRSIPYRICGGLLLVLLFPMLSRADQKEFLIGGNPVLLEDVTTQAAVSFRAFRLNRAANEWNAELVVSNKSSQTWEGPLLVVIDSQSNTSGLLRPDGLDDAAKAYCDLSSFLPS